MDEHYLFEGYYDLARYDIVIPHMYVNDDPNLLWNIK